MFLLNEYKIRKDNKVDLIMKHQTEDTVIQFKDICNFKETFPCGHHLWDVKDEAELLDVVKSDFFTC